MTIRLGKNGPFLACSGYPECKQTMNFTRDERGKIQPQEEAPRRPRKRTVPSAKSPWWFGKASSALLGLFRVSPVPGNAAPHSGWTGPGRGPHARRAYRPGLPPVRRRHALEKKPLWRGIPGLREISQMQDRPVPGDRHSLRRSELYGEAGSADDETGSALSTAAAVTRNAIFCSGENRYSRAARSAGRHCWWRKPANGKGPIWPVQTKNAGIKKRKAPEVPAPRGG